MKKTLLLLLLIFSFSQGVYAACNEAGYCDDAPGSLEAAQKNAAESKGTTDGVSGNDSSDSEGESITVKVTEKIPGAGCGERDEETKLYTCTIQPGFSTIQMIIGQIVKWFTALAALAGVLFIVINGILLSASGSDQKAKVKERITKTITGLILLLLSGLILSIIAPWIYM